MRRVVASTFLSLDGIMQAPGGPEEDRSGGFTLGGWTFDYHDDLMDLTASGFDGTGRELLLGRRTYEIFEAYWPYQSDDNPIAKTFNSIKKFVASLTLSTLSWNNSTVLEGEVVGAVKALKAQAGSDLQIIGSGELVRTLQTASLIDEYNIWTFPVVLGHGKRLFTNSAKSTALKLIRSSVSSTGVLMNAYVPAGNVAPSAYPISEPSEKELVRRKKITDEAGNLNERM